MNPFVDFLNSMHPVTGDSLGALAERQVGNEYAQKCHVVRKVGQYVLGEIQSGKKVAFIITGHAGDGKTSILVQLLRDLHMLPVGTILEKYKECVNDEGKKLLYVKDMSEIALDERKELLKKALQAPKHDSCSILVSNTGPLLSAFRALLESDAAGNGIVYDEDRKKIDHTILLDQMDLNRSNTINVGDYEFIMINIARIDNTSFAKEFLKKVLQPDNWGSCIACTHKDKCPVYWNAMILGEYKERVFEFVDSYYRYMYEYDQRMTIRQIQAHLCYALTGGLTCETIKANHKDQRIRYNFANTYFGYHDRVFQESVKEIKAIHQLAYLYLDKKTQADDYNLFVKEDYSVFPSKIRDLLENYAKKLLLRAYCQSADGKNSESTIDIRRMIRRFYLMYSQVDDNSLSKILNSCFGDGFVEYTNMIKKPNMPTLTKRKMRDIVFQALYTDNTGFLPKRSNEWLPLTLHRNDSTFQSVLLVLGEIRKEDLSIIQLPVDNRMNDIENEQAVYLSLNGKDYQLNLPLYQYFENRKNGIISSSYNPSLTHNIANLETFLNNCVHAGATDVIKLLCNTSKGQRTITVYYDGNNTRLSM